MPEYYVCGYSSGGYRYFKTKGIIDLVYVPCYDNHPLKYDRLYVSFKKRIDIAKVENDTWISSDEYDHLIWNELILEIVKGAEKYSKLDVSDIKRAIEAKLYYSERNYHHGWYPYFKEISLTDKEKETVINKRCWGGTLYRSKPLNKN